MATTLFFDGTSTSIPGAYTRIDASALDAVGAGAVGVIALLGTAEGGIPYTALANGSEIPVVRKLEQSDAMFRGGDLREAMAMAFAPSNDGDIPGGARQVLALKVNPATQSTAVLPNSEGDALDLTSIDYGLHTGQINVSIDDGTTQGKLLTIVFESITESVDDLGGDDIFTLRYADGTNGWATAAAAVLAGGHIIASGLRSSTGLDGDVATALAANRAVRVVSADNADIGQTVRVYGLAVGGALQVEDIVLNGTTPVAGLLTFAAGDVFAAEVIGTTAGAVTVEDNGGSNDDIFVIPLGANQSQGLFRGAGMFAAGTLSVQLDAAGTPAVILVGTSTTGAVQREKVVMTGATPVVTSSSWSSITHVILGDVAAARTFTISGTIALGVATIQNTIQKMADYFNARAVTGGGTFTFEILTGEVNFDPVNLDVSTTTPSILDTTVGFTADLYAVANWINSNSALISAEVSAGATGGAPSNTVSPIFLGGGVEGATSFSDYQAALNLLKQVVGVFMTVVPLSHDPAVHAAVKAHCAYMCGQGKSERDAVVGAQNVGLTDVPDKTELKSQILALNSRHVRVTGQAVTRFNRAGESERFQPMFQAVVLAGLQAGARIGTPLTRKYVDVVDFDQDSSWNPFDDADEMIQAGLIFLETISGRGHRVVRNVTSHLSSDNLAFIEASCNQAANYAALRFRTRLDEIVGDANFAGTIASMRSQAVGELGLLVEEGPIVDWDALTLEQTLDVLEVEVEMAPVIPINFVPITIHLVTSGKPAVAAA